MNVLSLNAGSSSLKYSVRQMPDEVVLCHGEARRIGAPTAQPPEFVHHANGKTTTTTLDSYEYAPALAAILEVLQSDKSTRPDVVSHRIVHGGTRFKEPEIVDDQIVIELEAIQHLAPIHNPPAITMLKICREQLPDLAQVCVFDTAFHASIPEYASSYALPRELTEQMGIRKYGFHGISHEYVATEAARLIGKPLDQLNAVSCHLGSGGASLCAIRDGQSVDNTMGLTPLQGLVMSTRSGDIDPGLVLRLIHQADGDFNKTEKLLNKNSGILGMTQASADLRDLLGDGARQDEPDLALRVSTWRLRKYLGAFLTVVGNADTIIFTDTLGETVPIVREMACREMESFGVKLDLERNNNPGELPADIATDDSPVRIWVIHTDEELALARMAWRTVDSVAV